MVKVFFKKQMEQSMMEISFKMKKMVKELIDLKTRHIKDSSKKAISGDMVYYLTETNINILDNLSKVKKKVTEKCISKKPKKTIKVNFAMIKLLVKVRSLLEMETLSKV